MKKSYLIIAVLITLVTIGSCERDDICPETTPTTPRLVIEFIDLETSNKTIVENINVRATGEPDFYFDNPVSDSLIKVPLRTNAENTTYEFTIFPTNNDDGTPSEDAPNQDKIKFTYAPTPVYISRACGFKTDFIGFQAYLQNDQDNWIQKIKVKQPNDIVDETTHLEIYISL